MSGYTQRMEHETERRHVGYHCPRGCVYGLAYDKCPEHGALPVARSIRVTLKEPIAQPPEEMK